MIDREQPRDLLAHRFKWAPHLAVRNLADVEREEILRAMILCEGNKTLAAKCLGIPWHTLHSKLKRIHAAADPPAPALG